MNSARLTPSGGFVVKSTLVTNRSQTFLPTPGLKFFNFGFFQRLVSINLSVYLHWNVHPYMEVNEATGHQTWMEGNDFRVKRVEDAEGLTRMWLGGTTFEAALGRVDLHSHSHPRSHSRSHSHTARVCAAASHLSFSPLLQVSHLHCTTHYTNREKYASRTSVFFSFFLFQSPNKPRFVRIRVLCV